ncbi:hypothetical protein BA6E_102301 [Bacteroidales bacterium 6E]|nr:hypothetical protein BA6E_102301 [Bacteroidales bacterium 6E]
MKITTRPPGYGTTPGLPVRLSSIAASRFFLNALVTEAGLHIVYHRLESVSYETILDHYETMDAAGHYRDIYISIYHDANEWIPPEGFLFDPFVIHSAEPTDGDDASPGLEPGLVADPGFMYCDWGPEVAKREADRANGFSLQQFMDESFGVTLRVGNFPFPLLERWLENHPLVSDGEITDILATVRARNPSNGNWSSPA